MGNQSIYVHGNNVKLIYPGGDGGPATPGHEMHNVGNYTGEGLRHNFYPWSDLVGLPTTEGMRFWSNGAVTNTFIAEIATPVIIGQNRVRMTRIGIKFWTSSANIIRLKVADGAREITFPFPAMSLGGNHKFTWDHNINFFDHPDPPVIDSSVSIFFDVRFPGRYSEILFCCVGCDFSY